jgi:hypothetical protein
MILKNQKIKLLIINGLYFLNYKNIGIFNVKYIRYFCHSERSERICI